MTTMKGLLKGLRYISQIFEDEKEDEISIGFPTDVKHVAHIGSDGPSTNQPSWMNEFKPDENKPVETQSRETQLEGGGNVGTGQDMSGTDSPTRQKKQHRRHRSGSGSISSPAREPPSSTAATKPRRPRATGGGESPAREEPKNADPPSSSSGAPKQSRKKKPGADKVPRPKGSDRTKYSDASQGNGGDSGEFCPSPAYDGYEERDGRGAL